MDNSIPNFPLGSFSTMEAVIVGATVNFLMNDSNEEWDMQTIEVHFNDGMTKVIHQIMMTWYRG